MKTKRQGLFLVLCLYTGWVECFVDQSGYRTIGRLTSHCWHWVTKHGWRKWHTKLTDASINMLCPITEVFSCVCQRPWSSASGIPHWAAPQETTSNFTLAAHHLQHKIQMLSAWHTNLAWSGLCLNCVTSFLPHFTMYSSYAKLLALPEASLFSPLLWLCLFCILCPEFTHPFPSKSLLILQVSTPDNLCFKN